MGSMREAITDAARCSNAQIGLKPTSLFTLLAAAFTMLQFILFLCCRRPTGDAAPCDTPMLGYSLDRYNDMLSHVLTYS